MATIHKEVSLSEVQPNPFRRLDLYPLDKLKIIKLRSSIGRTDFWENVVARSIGGHYEIAYGHHRIEAARQQLGKSAKVSLIVRDLDDEIMLKMMAADNDDAYNLTPGFILETVAAARDFVSKGDVTPTSKHSPTGGADLDLRISKFLAWPRERVKYALAQLHAIDDGELSKQAVEELPTIHAATVLHRHVKKAREAGKPIARSEQVQIAKRAAKAEEESPVRVIEKECIEASIPKETGMKAKKFETFLAETAQQGRRFCRSLEKVSGFRKDLESDIYRNTIEAHYLRSVCSELLREMEKLFGKEIARERKSLKA